MSKASLKKCVISKDLKRSKLSTRRMSSGRLFHKLGAADEKARSPKVFFSFKPGYFNLRPLAEWKLSRGSSLIAIESIE